VKLTHLALAWLIKNTDLDSALIGARNVQQLEESLEVLAVLDKFTVDVQRRINKILDNTPIPRTDFINFDPF
jgi:aryl-alcohol dehydrogenase-like predicted oxidoreductase